MNTIAKRADAYQLLIAGEWVTIPHDQAVKFHAQLGAILFQADSEYSDLFQKVACEFNVLFSDIVGKCRTDDIAFARHVCFYALRKFHKLSFPKIAQVFKVDNATPQHGVLRVENEVRTKTKRGKKVVDFMLENYKQKATE